MSGAYLQWLLLWVVYTLASLMTRSLVWSSSISAAFTKSRGLAIAVMLCGTAIATALGPTVTRLLIAEWGWRGGYIGLGLGWAGFAFVLALLFFRDVRRPMASTTGPAHAADTSVPGGLTMHEAVRSLTMQRLALAIFIQAVMGTAIIVHIVPMLTSDGLSLAQATTVAALLGVASLTGKLLTGWLIDRFGAGLAAEPRLWGPAWLTRCCCRLRARCGCYPAP
jgi:predicted MFS family arabinose efflux permease